MLEHYGLRPWEVNELTLFQLAYLMNGITCEHGRVTLKMEEAAGMLTAEQRRKLGIN
jgi:hypothetical protein